MFVQKLIFMENSLIPFFRNKDFGKRRISLGGEGGFGTLIKNIDKQILIGIEDYTTS